MKEQLKDIYENIDNNFERYIEELRNYFRVPGNSYTGEAIEEAAEATAKYIRDIGGEAKLVPLKGGFPVVYGKLKSKNPKAKTLLYYSHYDVVGVTPELWTVPPFAAEIVDAEKINLPAQIGKVIVARGANDKKGLDMAFALALGAIREVAGDVPVNVIFAIEGEEEIYSPNFKQFVDEYYDELNEADACYAPGSYRQSQLGVLVIHPGYNGLMEFYLEIESGAWGGTIDGRSLMSADGAFVDQPMLRLIHAITTMLSPDGKVLIEGFYDNWVPPTPEERREIEKSKELLSETTIAQFLPRLASVKRFKGGLPVEDLFEDCLVVPHIFCLGITSGLSKRSLSSYEELVPMKAQAKLQCRFGPDLSSEEILQKIRRHLYKCGFPEINVRCSTHRTEWSRSPVSEDIVQALVKMAEIHGVEYVIWPSSIGTCGLYLFNRPPLSKPVVCGALGHGGRQHVQDEYITVEGFRDQIKGTVTFLHEYASI